MAPKKVIIDCDAGTDDAQAIMMVLAYPELVELVAITAVHGNCSLDNVTRNIFRVLNLCGRPDVPVYAGCGSTLLGEPGLGCGFHGDDGLGDVPHLYPPADRLVQKEHAVPALIRLARKHQGEITLTSLGPLTNLASALQLDPDFGKNLKEVVVMGGNTTGQGNMTVCAEFNFYSDPEAAQLVLNHISAPLTLVHKEVCDDHSFSWDWYYNMIALPTEKAQFINTVEQIKVRNCKKRSDPTFSFYDHMAAAVTVDSSLIKLTEQAYVTVELNGTYTRGMVVVDRIGRLEKPNNVQLLTQVDKDRYGTMLHAALGGCK